MSYRRGLTVVEMLVALGVSVLVIMVLLRFFETATKETVGLQSRANLDADYSLASGAVQKSMSTSFRFMAKASAAAGQLRLILPLMDKCRDLSNCPGAISVIYASPERQQQDALGVRHAEVLVGKLKLSFEESLKDEIQKTLEVGNLVTVFLAPYAPLFRIMTAPTIENVMLDGDTAPKNYVRFEVQPLVVPASFSQKVSSYGRSDFSVLNQPGAGLLKVRLRSVGPLKVVPQQNRSEWNFATRDCAALNTGFTCAGTDAPLVDIHNLETFDLSASFRVPMHTTGACRSAQVFYDLRSAADSPLPTCATAGANAVQVRFPTPTDTPVPHAIHPDENPGDIDASALSLIKFENISALRFTFQLSRPSPSKPEGADNRTREVTFHVQFP